MSHDDKKMSDLTPETVDTQSITFTIKGEDVQEISDTGELFDNTDRSEHPVEPASQQSNQPTPKKKRQRSTGEVSMSLADIDMSVTKRYGCGTCGMFFGTSLLLTRHVRSHTGERPFICEVCNKDFSRRDRLNEHRRIHTGEKPYNCQFCGRPFTLRGQLVRHLLVHTGEKLYKCEICERSFAQKNTLLFHLRVHSREKPYKCELCDRDFGRKYTLNMHMRTHTNFRPYVCLTCDDAFITSSALAKHARKHYDTETDVPLTLEKIRKVIIPITKPSDVIEQVTDAVNKEPDVYDFSTDEIDAAGSQSSRRRYDNNLKLISPDCTRDESSDFEEVLPALGTEAEANKCTETTVKSIMEKINKDVNTSVQQVNISLGQSND